MLKLQFGFARANSLKPNKITPLLLAGFAVLGLGALGHYNQTPRQASAEAASIEAMLMPWMQDFEGSAPVQAASAVGQMAAAALAQKPEKISRQVELASGTTIARMLTNADVADADAQAVMNALGKVYDLRKLKGGMEANLDFLRTGNDETLQSLTFEPDLTHVITVTRDATGHFAANSKVMPIERERVAVQATINSSLYEAGNREGVPHNIMAGMIRVFAHAIDFQRDIHPGDKFEVLYDQPTAHDGTAVGEGTIIYAALKVGDKVKTLYRVTFADGTVDYFDASGKSLRRALLKTPIDGARMTSGFGMRMHPLLGYSKMHKGVDFGASIGTPIFAAGSGTVVDVGFKNGYGRYIRLRHNGTMETAYAHMSRFGRGMFSGAHVNQGDVIGFVGMSGRATGPHLHYEVLVNHQQINPMSVNMPTGRTLDGKALSQFKSGQGRIRGEFNGLLKADNSDLISLAAADPDVVAADREVMVAGVANGAIIKASAVTPAFPDSPDSLSSIKLPVR